MYESFFGLDARPFSIAPVASRYFPARAIEQARETLVRVVERAEGPGLIIGPAGTGKSLLCQVLAAAMRKRFRVATLASARLCTRRALLQNILFELKLPYRGLDEGELRLSLIDHLEPSESCPNGLLLLVDEAHNLPLRLLEELRMLTNFVRDAEPRVRLVLAASPLLEERLASPRLESFNQRIAARCYLQPLDRDECRAYVGRQIEAVGGVPHEVFDDSALAAVHRASDGIPRLLNQVCDHALLLACVAQQRPVTAAVVDEAWADLQQLPTPWTADAGGDGSDHNILEFGPLGDADGEGRDVSSGDEPVIVEWPRQAELEEEASEFPASRAVEDDSWESDEEYSPVAWGAAEVELQFDDVADPFSESFAEEEVVLDRETAREVECALSSAELVMSPSVEADAAAEAYFAGPSSEVPGLDTPEAAVTLSLDDIGGSETVVCGEPLDDRDMIVVDDETPAVETAPVAVCSQEYKELLADLRRG